jgi:hypothetical protein
MMLFSALSAAAALRLFPRGEALDRVLMTQRKHALAYGDPLQHRPTGDRLVCHALLRLFRKSFAAAYLQKPAKATNRLLSMFFFRSVDAWNALPPALRSSPTLPAFKRGLKHFDLSAYLKGSSSAV